MRRRAGASAGPPGASNESPPGRPSSGSSPCGAARAGRRASNSATVACISSVRARSSAGARPTLLLHLERRCAAASPRATASSGRPLGVARGPPRRRPPPARGGRPPPRGRLLEASRGSSGAPAGAWRTRAATRAPPAGQLRAQGAAQRARRAARSPRTRAAPARRARARPGRLVLRGARRARPAGASARARALHIVEGAAARDVEDRARVRRLDVLPRPRLHAGSIWHEIDAPPRIVEAGGRARRGAPSVHVHGPDGDGPLGLRESARSRRAPAPRPASSTRRPPAPVVRLVEARRVVAAVARRTCRARHVSACRCRRRDLRQQARRSARRRPATAGGAAGATAPARAAVAPAARAS